MFRSIRWRLQLWHALILLAVVTCFGTWLYVQVRRATMRETDTRLETAARILDRNFATISDLRVGWIGPASWCAGEWPCWRVRRPARASVSAAGISTSRRFSARQTGFRWSRAG